jgi:hypothetical protein
MVVVEEVEEASLEAEEVDVFMDVIIVEDVAMVVITLVDTMVTKEATMMQEWFNAQMDLRWKFTHLIDLLMINGTFYQKLKRLAS